LCDEKNVEKHLRMLTTESSPAILH